MELAAVTAWWGYVDDVVRIGILLVVVTNLIVLGWLIVEVKSVVSSWRVQHSQRTPVAAAYGMAVVLQNQHPELTFEARVRIYQALVEQLSQAVSALDAGSYVKDAEK